MPNAASKPWTQDEERELVKLQESRVSLNRMAIRLRRTKRAVSVRLAELRSRESKTRSSPRDDRSTGALP